MGSMMKGGDSCTDAILAWSIIHCLPYAILCVGLCLLSIPNLIYLCLCIPCRNRMSGRKDKPSDHEANHDGDENITVKETAGIVDEHGNESNDNVKVSTEHETEAVEVTMAITSPFVLR